LIVSILSFVVSSLRFHPKLPSNNIKQYEEMLKRKYITFWFQRSVVVVSLKFSFWHFVHSKHFQLTVRSLIMSFPRLQSWLCFHLPTRNISLVIKLVLTFNFKCLWIYFLDTFVCCVQHKWNWVIYFEIVYSNEIL